MPFKLYAQERDNPWEKAAINHAPRVLALLEDNPFAPPAEMEFNFSLRYEPYIREKALDELSHNPEAKIGVRSTLPFYLDGGVDRDPLQNGFTLGGDTQYFERAEMQTQVAEYLLRWRQVLPAFCWSGAFADDRENFFFFEQLQLEPLPDCFGSTLGWCHVVSPRGYEPYFNAEDLRLMPAHKLEELPDGAFAITCYPGILDFAGDEATRRIVEITNYLNERRKD